jgi:hypothetical protein
MTQLSLFTKRPAARPRPASEFGLQCQVADLLRRWKKPSWRFTHIASGELRTRAAAVKLYRMGVMPGWPDLILVGPMPPKVFFMEFKRQGGKLTVEQRAFKAVCKDLDIPHEVVSELKQALAILEGWGVLQVHVEVAA